MEHMNEAMATKDDGRKKDNAFHARDGTKFSQ